MFFSGFDDALETFSLDALLLSTTVEKSPVVVLERYATHPDQPVSKPKAIVYDDWYARAKEALTTNDFRRPSTKTKKKNKKYAFTLEEKKKKKKKRTTTRRRLNWSGGLARLPIIIIIIITTTTGRPERKKETTMERC